MSYKKKMWKLYTEHREKKVVKANPTASHLTFIYLFCYVHLAITQNIYKLKPFCLFSLPSFSDIDGWYFQNSIDLILVELTAGISKR